MQRSRDELVYLLSEAAELEHLLCCNYLFAAFSLKRRTDEGLSHEQLGRVQDWARSIILVARQEMEHLSLVNNLLTAIGGAPHLRRPNFPQPARYNLDALTLERFGMPALERFIRFEAPDPLGPGGAARGLQEAPVRWQGLGVAPYPVPYRSIGDLYAQILDGIDSFPGGDPSLFVGPPDAQVDGAELMLDFPRLGQLGGVFAISLFPVTDAASATRAIELIVEQGEGGPREVEGSHHWRFLRIKAELEQAGFDPARPVVANPVLRHQADQPQGTLVTNEATREVMDLFNAAYETMLLLLIRFYGHTDETAAQLQALRYAAFFPMMTMVIRPLAEILTELPAFAGGGEARAGPSFEIYRSIDLLPHQAAAWVVLRERLAQLAADGRRLSGQGIHSRLAYVADSLELLAAKFAADLRG